MNLQYTSNIQELDIDLSQNHHLNRVNHINNINNINDSSHNQFQNPIHNPTFSQIQYSNPNPNQIQIPNQVLSQEQLQDHFYDNQFNHYQQNSNTTNNSATFDANSLYQQGKYINQFSLNSNIPINLHLQNQMYIHSNAISFQNPNQAHPLNNQNPSLQDFNNQDLNHPQHRINISNHNQNQSQSSNVPNNHRLGNQFNLPSSPIYQSRSNSDVTELNSDFNTLNVPMGLPVNNLQLHSPIHINNSSNININNDNINISNNNNIGYESFNNHDSNAFKLDNLLEIPNESLSLDDLLNQDPFLDIDSAVQQKNMNLNYNSNFNLVAGTNITNFHGLKENKLESEIDLSLDLADYIDIDELPPSPKTSECSNMKKISTNFDKQIKDKLITASKSKKNLNSTSSSSPNKKTSKIIKKSKSFASGNFSKFKGNISSIHHSNLRGLEESNNTCNHNFKESRDETDDIFMEINEQGKTPTLLSESSPSITKSTATTPGSSRSTNTILNNSINNPIAELSLKINPSMNISNSIHNNNNFNNFNSNSHDNSSNSSTSKSTKKKLSFNECSSTLNFSNYLNVLSTNKSFSFIYEPKEKIMNGTYSKKKKAASGSSAASTASASTTAFGKSTTSTSVSNVTARPQSTSAASASTNLLRLNRGGISKSKSQSHLLTFESKKPMKYQSNFDNSVIIPNEKTYAASSDTIYNSSTSEKKKKVLKDMKSGMVEFQLNLNKK